MPRKNVIQDIVKIASRGRADLGRPGHGPSFWSEKEKHPPRSHRSLWIIVIIALIALTFALSSVLAGAVVKITPRSQNFSLERSFTAQRDAAEGLAFELMSITDRSVSEISASGTKDAPEKASGRVILYNAYSSSAARLLTETRLEAPDGKIFKTTSAITIPGYKMENGQTVPGSMEVNVLADKPGEEYNLGLTDFKIVGFKGTAKYGKFYGRSKTPLAGGTSGKVYTATKEEAESARAQLIEGLRAKLSARLSSELPAGFVLWSDALFFRIGDQEPVLFSPTEKIPISSEGTAYALIFNKENLTQELVKILISDDYDSQAVFIPGLSEFKFSLSDKEKLTPEEAKTISFNLAGNVQIVWEIDENGLRKALAAKNKKNFSSIVNDFPSVYRSQSQIRPFWIRRFPKNPEKIKIINTLPPENPNNQR